MANKMKYHADYKREALKDPELKNAYDELEEEYTLLRQLISARHKAGKTQAEVAELMGTKTSAVGRIESRLFYKKHSPTLATLQKYAHALGFKIEFNFVPETISRRKVSP
jgi:DNA-binding XRE family transcriptional regulator